MHGIFSSFRARFSSFRVAHFVFFSSFRQALFRLFVISLGVFSLFRLFAWRYFVLAPRHNARRKDERMKYNEMAQTSHHRIYCRKFMTLSNRICKRIRIIINSSTKYLWRFVFGQSFGMHYLLLLLVLQS